MPITGEPYLLAVVRALAEMVERVSDPADQVLLRASQRVLAEMAYRMHVAADPSTTAPQIIGASVGPERLKIETRIQQRDGTLADDRDMADYEGHLLEDQESYVQRHLGGTTPDSAPVPLEVDRAALLQVLRRHDGTSLEIVDIKPVLAGFNKQILLVSLAGCRTLPSDLVIRMDMPKPNVPSSVLDEFPLQQRLYDLGIRVPRPLFTEDHLSPIARPLFAMERVAGALDGHLLTPPKSRAAAEQLARELGKLHAIPVADLTDIVPASSDQIPMATEIANLKSQWKEQFDAPSLTAEIAFDWLERHADAASGQTCLIHGDIGFHNILVQDGKLSAILDWELAHIGSPAEDIGYCSSIIRAVMPHEEFMAIYVESGGTAMSPQQINFYTLFGTIKLIVMMLHPRRLFETGELGGVRNAEPILYHLSLIMKRLSDELRLTLRD